MSELIGCVQHDCAKCKAHADAIEALESSLFELRDLCSVYESQRDALQAQLAAAQGQEPVAWIKYLIGAVAKSNGQCYEMLFVPCEGYEPLYAAPIPQPAQQAQPEPHLFEFWWAEYMPDATQEQAFKAWSAAPSSKGVGIEQQAQPERAPLSDAELKAIAESAADKIWPGAGGVGWTDKDTEYHREFYNGIKQGGQHD